MKRCVVFVGLVFFLFIPVHAFAEQGKTTLYEQLGGEAKVGKIVYRALEYSHSDPRTIQKFENSRIERNALLITEYICDLADGPCEYSGQELHKVHYGLGLNSAHFNAMAESFQKAMRDYDVPFSVQSKLMARLAPKHHDVVVRSRLGK